jgi:glycolate dehydrogenase FAD-binding subunit
VLTPHTPEELAEALRAAAGRKQTITLSGNSTKRRMAGPIETSDLSITTTGIGRTLSYEPRDLTISVEAGMPWCELAHVVAGNGQMIPLDPPFAEGATVGGVIASNSSGPRRRLYGTARDLVIGMKFATLEGKLVQSGGMVVKNVAGLDMAKLMIGSFGTLAAVAVVNFKLMPAPEMERSFLLRFDSLAKAIAARGGVLKSVLQPAAVDLLNPEAAAALGAGGWVLAFRVGGNAPVIERYEREFAALGDSVAFAGERQDQLWRHIQNFTPQFLQQNAEGAVVRVSCSLKEVEGVMASLPGPAIARAGSGVCYGYFGQADQAAAWMTGAAPRGWKLVVEFCAESRKGQIELWPVPGSDFEVMKRVKQMFDPDGLLNRGRLYRRI